jgi:hypothetical protein
LDRKLGDCALAGNRSPAIQPVALLTELSRHMIMGKKIEFEREVEFL